MTEFGDSVYEGGVEDAEDMDPAENLTGDGTPESLDEPQETLYDPPDREPQNTRWGTTLEEEREGEPLDMRLAEEEPDISPDDPRRVGRAEGRPVGGPGRGRARHRRAGRDRLRRRRAGFASSAEEAAVHLVDEDELNEQSSNEEDTGDGF